MSADFDVQIFLAEMKRELREDNAETRTMIAGLASKLDKEVEKVDEVDARLQVLEAQAGWLRKGVYGTFVAACGSLFPHLRSLFSRLGG